jgi:O-acetyl-ADP-ribose deacetylase (regulator of RNase III)
MIDKETGYDDDYDEAIKWCIEEISNEIHRIKELDSLAVEEIYYVLFNQEVEEAYNNYLEELKV